jgi:hypothetical protein
VAEPTPREAIEAWLRIGPSLGLRRRSERLVRVALEIIDVEHYQGRESECCAQWPCPRAQEQERKLWEPRRATRR